MTSDTAHTSREFNYCFWAKLIVAIPAIPLVAAIAASFFTDTAMQVVAGGIAVTALIWLAIKIDKMPCLLRKVVDRK